MKTAISIPDDVYTQGERFAEHAKISRSELYSRALREFLSRHAPDEVTAEWDAVIEELGQPQRHVSEKAAQRALEQNEW